MAAVPLPPWRARAAFWVLGRRLPPEHRPWVAATVTAPGFTRRRLRAVLALQTLFVVVPQLAFAATGGGWFNVIFAGLVLIASAGGYLLAERLSRPEDLQRLLAHYGVTADGQVVEPVSFWRTSGVTPWTAGLLAVSIGVLVTGIVVVADRYVSPDRCRTPDPAAVRAVEALLGRTTLQGGPPSPPLFDGGSLQAAQRVNTPLDGLSYLSGYVVPGPGEESVGPAVWRIIEPGGVFPVTQLNVAAADESAREVTPTAGYASNSPPDPLAARARDCVRIGSDG